MFLRVNFMCDNEINETFKDLIDIVNESPKVELISHKSAIVQLLRKIPPFNLGDKYTNLDDLVVYINSTNKKKELMEKNQENKQNKPNKKGKQSSISTVAKGKKNNKKAKKDPDELVIDKFKRNVEQQSVPKSKVTKIEINLSKDWLNTVLNK